MERAERIKTLLTQKAAIDEELINLRNQASTELNLFGEKKERKPRKKKADKEVEH